LDVVEYVCVSVYKKIITCIVLALILITLTAAATKGITFLDKVVAPVGFGHKIDES